MKLLPIKHVELSKRYWRWLVRHGVKQTNRNTWICGNRVSLKLGIVPYGNALSWGSDDRDGDILRISLHQKWYLENLQDYVTRAIVAAITKDFEMR